MRRKDRALTAEETAAVLEKGVFGVLSTAGSDGLPYGIPVSYVYQEGRVYFHCALEGRKAKNMAARPQVSFCVVGFVQAVHDGGFGTYYESAVLEGLAEQVQDVQERILILHSLADKYLPAYKEHAPAYISKLLRLTSIYRIIPQTVSGKARRPKAQSADAAK
ncbi:MAG: pyridoxamine 5'-phosphate oxidase family protein [Deltaproteobacteria bacterium]|jgi:nitroimidazol reductase NimA-like FMN-containing flavoprotein (pyridoxamine 5'-phosphate oxidase superfamily)|nr:pyridoxamine 5'-phosphate oxidase family protein [Deltaproteobacteria bacterium]